MQSHRQSGRGWQTGSWTKSFLLLVLQQYIAELVTFLSVIRFMFRCFLNSIKTVSITWKNKIFYLYLWLCSIQWGRQPSMSLKKTGKEIMQELLLHYVMWDKRHAPDRWRRTPAGPPTWDSGRTWRWARWWSLGPDHRLHMHTASGGSLQPEDRKGERVSELIWKNANMCFTLD